MPLTMYCPWSLWIPLVQWANIHCFGERYAAVTVFHHLGSDWTVSGVVVDTTRKRWNCPAITHQSITVYVSEGQVHHQIHWLFNGRCYLLRISNSQCCYYGLLMSGGSRRGLCWSVSQANSWKACQLEVAATLTIMLREQTRHERKWNYQLNTPKISNPSYKLNISIIKLTANTALLYAKHAIYDLAWFLTQCSTHQSSHNASYTSKSNCAKCKCYGCI